MFNATSLLRIIVEVIGNDAIEGARRDVIEIVKARHQGVEDITVVTSDAVLDTFNTIFDVITYALAGIAAISLMVAGVLIMNVMLVAVSQRTEEIGLLKALGAKQRQIIGLFLTEAVFCHFGRPCGSGTRNAWDETAERGLSDCRSFRAGLGAGRRRRHCSLKRPRIRDSACAPGRAAGPRGSTGRALTDACPRRDRVHSAIGAGAPLA